MRQHLQGHLRLLLGMCGKVRKSLPAMLSDGYCFLHDIICLCAGASHCTARMVLVAACSALGHCEAAHGMRSRKMSGGTQNGHLTCALLQPETTARFQNAVRICAHCLFPKHCSNMLFELVPIANVPKQRSKNEESRWQKHTTDDLIRPWPRPGDL